MLTKIRPLARKGFSSLGRPAVGAPREGKKAITPHRFGGPAGRTAANSDRRRASRKSSKRVHDGEPVFNSRTYCYPADCTMQSRSFISGFDPFFFDPTWTRTLTGLSTDQHPQTHSSCVTVGSTQLRIEGWRH